MQMKDSDTSYNLELVELESHGQRWNLHLSWHVIILTSEFQTRSNCGLVLPWMTRSLPVRALLVLGATTMSMIVVAVGDIPARIV
jgi:hypothetical protein